MGLQTTNTLFMVRPAAFCSNPGTQASNAFQDAGAVDPAQLQAAALAEFDALVSLLRAHDVRVLVHQDRAQPPTPDSIYPNNWFMTELGGPLVLFPMFEASRRLERCPDVLAAIFSDHGWHVPVLSQAWLEPLESRGLALEGTGSMVLDREARVAYAAYSSRTRREALELFGKRFGYALQPFDAADEDGRAYYHTNVLMSLGEDFAVCCLEAVDGEQRAPLEAALRAGGRRVIPITRAQVRAFAGNLLELRSLAGERLVLLSISALQALGLEQRAGICAGGARLVAAGIPNIERYGGGGVRCMLAELFVEPE